MRQLLIAAVVIGFGLSAPVGAQAATEDVVQGMADKAISGGIDMFTGIIEFPHQIIKGYQKGFPMIQNEAGSKTVGTVLGFFRGISHAAGRTGWGAMELFGFWTAAPPDNVGIGVPLDSQYAWEKGEQYSIFEPSLSEGIKPIGRKLVRGLGDNFLGIIELPVETMQGAEEGNALKGLGKGIWYWLSREAYGFGSIMTCLAPNPVDNPGYTYDEQYVWDTINKPAETN